MENNIGGFAVSTAGHDKDTMYVIIGREGNRFLLADGKYKTLEKPKRKSGKHLAVLHAQGEFPKGRPERNEEVKRALKLQAAKVPTK